MERETADFLYEEIKARIEDDYPKEEVLDILEKFELFNLMSQKERLENAKKLLLKIVRNWKEEDVEEYGADRSFDEIVHEILKVRLK